MIRALKPIDQQQLTLLYHLSLLGATMHQMALALGVSVGRLNSMMSVHPEVREAIERGRLRADAEVANSLYHAALGYDYYEDVVTTYRGVTEVHRVMRHRPANPWAAARWLAVRQPQQWQATQRVDITQTTTHNHHLDLTGISTEDLETLHRLGVDAQRRAVDAATPNPDDTYTDYTPADDEGAE